MEEKCKNGWLLKIKDAPCTCEKHNRVPIYEETGDFVEVITNTGKTVKVPKLKHNSNPRINGSNTHTVFSNK